MAAKKPQPLRELRVLKESSFPREIQRLFAQHGVSVKDEGSTYLLTFPEGTTRTESTSPRGRSARFAAVLPDGCTIGYAQDSLSSAVYLNGGGSIHEHKATPVYMQQRSQGEEAPTDAKR